MWKSVMSGIILHNIETLTHYQRMKDQHGNTVEDIFRYVTGVVTDLPWYFRLPVKTLAGVTGVLCLLFTGASLPALPSERRTSFLRRTQVIPSFSMLHRLVRSLVFLKLFDSLPFVPGNTNVSGM